MSKSDPVTRPSMSAWEETSITTCVTPSSRICANSLCSIGASGVVSSVATSRPMIRVPVVPINPTLQPAAVRPFSSM